MSPSEVVRDEYRDEGRLICHVLYEDGTHRLTVETEQTILNSDVVEYQQIAQCGGYAASTEYWCQQLPKLWKMRSLIEHKIPV